MTYKAYKIKKITKGIMKSYIKFELDDYVEFSNEKHSNSIFCINEYPFTTYQKGDEIEVDLTNAKHMNYRDYHQDIVKKTSRSYSGGYYDDYSPQPNDSGGSRPSLTQSSITLSAYEVEAVYDFLYGSLEWLELYSEKENPNRLQKKQLPKTITRPDIPYADSKEVKGHFSTSLTGLRVITSDKPQFLLEKLQTGFFSWLDGSGHNADNCSFELAQSLVDFYNILIGKGEDFAKRRRKETDDNIAKMTAEERKRNFHQIINAYQEPLENEDKVFEAMKGQTYRDVNNENRFSGDADRGKEIFKEIEKFFKEQQTRQKAQQDYREWEKEEGMEGIESSVSQPINQKLVNWIKQQTIIEKEIAVLNKEGNGYSFEDWAIHSSAKREIDSRTGCLKFDPKNMYKVKDLSEAEQKAIGYKSEVGLQTNSSSITPKNDNVIGKGGIIAIIGISALLIGGVVVVKKRLNKKVKK